MLPSSFAIIIIVQLSFYLWAIEWLLKLKRHYLNEVLIVTLNAILFQHLLKKWYCTSLLLYKHWLHQYLFLNCLYTKYSLIIWSTNQASKLAKISCCFVSSRCISFWLYFLFIGCLAALSARWWLVRGNLPFILQSFAFSKPQVTEDVSPRPYLPKQKEPSYRGDIGWDWFKLRQFAPSYLSFILTTNCAITGNK